ncbi:FAD-dependent monooxygenase [Nocardia sp. CA2R105]|uniref:FAD-dependent monooxygenase n=1 Tax=Nocardia coffeae TaxID=2873381 RepID=UPI001CA61778|nr:FAD-dependent monooxygenase [Nocardia coffeae]MBY8859643.1 FAD-dependent monooxygenase [Nocardia coffeae]
MDGNRIGIIGGSIGGCATAILLRRAGCDVTVFERSSGRLRDRGQGVGISAETRAELVAENLIDADLPMQPVAERSWIGRDGDAPFGRVLWEHPFTSIVHNWGMLWANLRNRIPDTDYRDGVPVTRIEPDADAVTLHHADGTAERFDVVIGADGYRSAARALVDPAATAEYSGYVLWRGGYPVAELPPTMLDALRRRTVTVTYPGGHAMVMLIPDEQAPGLRVYWALYYQPAQSFSLGIDPITGDLPPGAEDLLTEYFPPSWGEVIAKSRRDTTVVHPVVDIRASRYASGRIALIGDAATVVRPHTASGAVKAVEDALALGRLCRAGADWDAVLTGYDAQRRPAGAALADLGVRLGRAQVTDTPPWTSMTSGDFAEWMRSALDGSRHYLYDVEE